ncbi:period circadian protein homolog 3-like isoform X1 [Denticeps clupeoides]|uniref:PAS domain-containing protein n=1 Tax=Denticeps clupeoides TaxID=299321 RepID=A0AAY4CU00_9TELE|nr:period circadian protein homolog 3-like isoform X1 [Denticeps clupeoides]
MTTVKQEHKPIRRQQGGAVRTRAEMSGGQDGCLDTEGEHGQDPDTAVRQEVRAAAEPEHPSSGASGMGSGEDEEGEERPRRQQDGSSADDVEMNSSHDSSSGNEASGGGTRRKGGGASSNSHTSSASQSPSSITAPNSQSSKSAGAPSSSSLHSSSRHTESSEPTDSWRDQTHREMMQTVQEMKKRLPSEKRSRSKASTVAALNYALNCVKQVQANSEYYKLLMCNGVEERSDATVCTLEELECITSEHTLKNTDTFVVVFSLATGRVVYASEQAHSILNCKRKFLDSARFVEMLFHQDVNVFYSYTAQPHLPPWNVGTDHATVLFECAQVKSFFCRIRGGKDREGEMRYNPFRITPYLLKVQGAAGDEEQPCCLALAERIISGYEAPRIPMDKRIFTTTHSPGCVFLEVDDRAVPLLGYLPQDLIGTSLLTCLHPEDRTNMLAMHRKILKYAGQPPFEHSPIRFHCQNGDYVTLDTSWSSFINPWSRKVAFIIGRHKVRTGPLNEDVFSARSKEDVPVMYEEIRELQAMIYKLFLQPVHNTGSSGYGSLGSNGSHEHYISVASSSDSNGNLWEDCHREPMTLQQVCADVTKVKSWGQQAYLDSRSKLIPLSKAGSERRTPIPNGTQNAEVRGHLQQSLEESRKQPHVPSYQQINCVDSIIRYLESCTGPAMKRKSESLSIATSSSSSTTEEDKTPAAPMQSVANPDAVRLGGAVTLNSQVSASSAVTEVHTTAAVVGALSDKAMSVVSVTSQCSYSSTIVHVPQPESEVTALEDAPMGSEPAEQALPAARPANSSAAAPEEFRMVGLTKEVLSAHTQKEEQEYVDRFRHRILQSPYSSYLQQDNGSMAHSLHRGDYASGWNRSKSGKPKHKRPKPQGSSDSYASQPGNYRSPRRLPQPPNSSWPSSETSQPQPSSMAFPVAPVIMPPYFTMMGQVMQEQGGGMPAMLHPEQQTPAMSPYLTPVMAVILPNFPSYPANCVMFPQGVATPGPASNVPVVPPSSFTAFPPNLAAQGPVAAPVVGSPAPPSWLEEDVDDGQPPALFSSSRSSSPLQLNLLQEELPKPADLQPSAGHPENLHEQRAKGDDVPCDSGNQDAQSSSSELLDLLLHEDARSGTGSNVSGSGSGESGGSLGSGSGSGSNGTTTSHTAGSSNSSKYFASNDSSDTSRKARKTQEAAERGAFDKCVEDSIWTMIEHTPEPVMMTYQIHSRDRVKVLQEDREKLRMMQPLQPWFTREQKEELADVHTWMHHRSVPQEIDTQGCVSCSTSVMESETGPAHPTDPPTPNCSIPKDDPLPDPRPDSDT